MKRSRNSITNDQKAALRAHHKTHLHLSNLELQKWFQETYQQPINPSSVSRILSARSAYLDNLESHQLSNKRRRTEQWPELDQAIYEWIQRSEGRVPVNQEAIREKARAYWPVIYPGREVPQFSNGWLRGFQERRNVHMGRRRTANSLPAEPVRVISHYEALECIRRIRLYEEQQVDGDQVLVLHLLRHERVVQERIVRERQEQQEQQQQQGIDFRFYFGLGG